MNKFDGIDSYGVSKLWIAVNELSNGIGHKFMFTFTLNCNDFLSSELHYFHYTF